MNLHIIMVMNFALVPICMRAMEQNIVSTVHECWQHKYYTHKHATLRFMYKNENIPEKYPWCDVAIDQSNKRVMVDCIVRTSKEESKIGQVFMLDTLQVPTKHVFFENVPSKKMIVISDASIEVCRGYHILERVQHYCQLCRGILLQGTLRAVGDFCCIPALWDEKQYLYLFKLDPFTYVATLGAYDNDDHICCALSPDGSLIVVVSKDATIQVFRIAPYLKPYFLTHAKMDPLKNVSFRFA